MEKKTPQTLEVIPSVISLLLLTLLQAPILLLSPSAIAEASLPPVSQLSSLFLPPLLFREALAWSARTILKVL